LRRFLRGGTWPGLAREIAWQAASAAGLEYVCVEWLTGLVEERLAADVEGLEFVIDRAREVARTKHLRLWPHDPAGGETAASIEAEEEGAQALARLYVETLEWAGALLEERLQTAGRPAARPRVPAPRRTRAPAQVEPPTLISQLVEPARERFGWPRRR